MNKLPEKDGKKVKRVEINGKKLTFMKPSNSWVYELQDNCTTKNGVIDILKYAKTILKQIPERPDLEDFREFKKDLDIELDNRTISFRDLSLEQILKYRSSAIDSNGKPSSFLMIKGMLDLTEEKLDMDEDFNTTDELDELMIKFNDEIKTDAIEELIERFKSFR